jgi:hypothetical protein
MAYGTNKRKKLSITKSVNRTIKKEPLPTAPEGTTLGKNRVGQDVSYKPGYQPKEKSRAAIGFKKFGMAEGPSMLKNYKDLNKVTRLNKKIEKVSGKRESLNKSGKSYDKKFDKLSIKRAKLVTKRKDYLS